MTFASKSESTSFSLTRLLYQLIDNLLSCFSLSWSIFLRWSHRSSAAGAQDLDSYDDPELSQVTKTHTQLTADSYVRQAILLSSQNSTDLLSVHVLRPVPTAPTKYLRVTSAVAA